jgi:hypothetical protein
LTVVRSSGEVCSQTPINRESCRISLTHSHAGNNPLARTPYTSCLVVPGTNATSISSKRLEPNQT